MKNIFITIISIFIFSLVFAGPTAWSGSLPATSQAYYDNATGHKYIKNQDGSYTEYSKKGKRLRSNVPNTLPLLVSGKYITPVTENHLLVYEKNHGRMVRHLVLPAGDTHPEGWRCKQLLSVIDKGSTPFQVEGYSSPEEEYVNPADDMFK